MTLLLGVVSSAASQEDSVSDNMTLLLGVTNMSESSDDSDASLKRSSSSSKAASEALKIQDPSPNKTTIDFVISRSFTHLSADLVSGMKHTVLSLQWSPLYRQREK